MVGRDWRGRQGTKPGQTYHDAVIPREDGQLVETGDKVPPGCDVARDKDPKGEDGKGVHESGWFKRTAFFSLHA